MDSFDLFKKLTTNLSFDSSSHPVKRKSSAEDDKLDTNKRLRPALIAESKNSDHAEQKSEKSKKGTNKKRNEFLIAQEKINHLRNIHHININGNDVLKPIEKIDELENDVEFLKSFQLKVDRTLIKNLKSYNFEELTPIQMQVIPVMLDNREVLACAPTGSGKTISFLFPLLSQISHNIQANTSKEGIKAMILAPTRELSNQIYIECLRLSNGMNINVHMMNKANKEKKNSKNFTNKCDILITTPNRLIHMLSDENLNKSLKSVDWMVIDEADKLFEEGQKGSGFRDQLGKIYKACDNPKIKHALFSATYTTDVEQWCKLSLNNMVQVSIGRKNTAAYSVQQDLYYVGTDEGKLIALRNLFKEGFEPPVLIFVETKERANHLFKELIYEDVNVDMISSDRTEQQRDNTMRSFRQGKIWVLICTELLSRGIDFKGVNLVINYDFPLSGISYVHSIGRCGRAGKVGRAITYFTDDDLPNLRKIVNIMRESGCNVPEFYLSKINQRKIKGALTNKKKKLNKVKSKKTNGEIKIEKNDKVKKIKKNKNDDGTLKKKSSKKSKKLSEKKTNKKVKNKKKNIVQ